MDSWKLLDSIVFGNQVECLSGNTVGTGKGFTCRRAFLIINLMGERSRKKECAWQTGDHHNEPEQQGDNQAGFQGDTGKIMQYVCKRDFLQAVSIDRKGQQGDEIDQAV